VQALAQPVHQDLDHVGLHVLLVREHPVQDLLLGQRLAAALDQGTQHRMFAWRQAQGVVGQRELLGAGIEGQRTAGEARVVAAAGAANQGHQARFELGHFERLGEKIVGPFVQAADPFDQ
jgi:hypothetical protein